MKLEMKAKQSDITCPSVRLFAPKATDLDGLRGTSVLGVAPLDLFVKLVHVLRREASSG